jgi:hypothetical protein
MLADTHDVLLEASVLGKRQQEVEGSVRRIHGGVKTGAD